METSRVTSRGQTTIPSKIRKSVGIKSGDILMFIANGDRVIMKKIEPRTDEYLESISETLNEWLSPEDEEAWRDL